MKILVCGSRSWRDKRTIYNTLDEIGGAYEDPQGMNRMIELLIHGGCGHFDEETRETVGADKIADDWAVTNWVPVKALDAEWEKHGRAAGPIRNRAMLDEQPDLVLAFHGNLEASKGTKDMVAQARRAGVPVRIVTSEAGRQAGIEMTKLDLEAAEEYACLSIPKQASAWILGLVKEIRDLREALAGYDVSLEYVLNEAESEGIAFPKTREALASLRKNSGKKRWEEQLGRQEGRNADQ